MLLPYHALAYLAAISVVTAAAALDDFFSSPDFRFHAKRQGDAYQPTNTLCGTGTTWESSCGPGYILCGSQAQFLCYDPRAGDTCCARGADDAWACDASSFCLVDGYCCPHGDNPTTCAQANVVTLPANFSTTTSTSSKYGYVMSSFGASIATAYSIGATSTIEVRSSNSTFFPKKTTNHTSAYTIPSTALTIIHASSTILESPTKPASTTSSITVKATATATMTVAFSSGTLNGTFFTPTASAASTSLAVFAGAANIYSELSMKGPILMLVGIGAGACLVW